MRSPAAEDADSHKSGCPHRIRICPAKRCIAPQNVKRHFPGVFNRKNTAAGERENRRRPTQRRKHAKKTCLYNKEGKYRKIQQFSCILSVIFISKMVQIKCFIDKKTCSHLKKFLFDYILLRKEMLKCLSENGKNKPSASAVNY